MGIKAHTKYICELINFFVPEGGVGAEIGVHKGHTSKYILEKTKTKLLLMIDPWKKNFDITRKFYTTHGKPNSDFKRVTKFFNETFPDRAKIIREKSAVVAEDNSTPDDLDFVFIDANHTYESVMQDLMSWVPKIRSGGLVAGHDWSRRFPGVVKAVRKFCRIYDPFRPPIKPIDLPDYYIPAPGKGTPVVMKSWPHGHLWWAINR